MRDLLTFSEYHAHVFMLCSERLHGDPFKVRP